jgi:hypothetical protein
MHVPLAAQAVCPVGQAQVPPGPEQVSPETVQSVLVQHVVPTMHWLLAAQAFWPPGQVQVEPGVGQVSPAIMQSFVVQQAPSGMQVSPETHADWLGGQFRTQLPDWQRWFAPQDLPHAPQLAGSVWRSEQYGCVGPPSRPPGHSVAFPPASPPLQLVEHMPLAQTRPVPHALPQAPQFCGSTAVLTQAPLHTV